MAAYTADLPGEPGARGDRRSGPRRPRRSRHRAGVNVGSRKGPVPMPVRPMSAIAAAGDFHGGHVPARADDASRRPRSRLRDYWTGWSGLPRFGPPGRDERPTCTARTCPWCVRTEGVAASPISHSAEIAGALQGPGSAATFAVGGGWLRECFTGVVPPAAHLRGVCAFAGWGLGRLRRLVVRQRGRGRVVRELSKLR